MPLLMVMLFALFGIGYFSHHEKPRSPVMRGALVLKSPRQSRWACVCRKRLAVAARDFDAGTAGDVSVARLPSGVDAVVYGVRAADGSRYQVLVTEAPQDSGAYTVWQGAPGGPHGFKVERHERGRIARIDSDGPRGPDFVRLFDAAASLCIGAN